MAEQQQSSNNIETNQLIQKFVKDRNESFSDGKSLSHHRNGAFQSIKSTEVFAVNEPSTLECIKLPYTYLGSIKLSGEQRYMIASGDEVNSEIGIADMLNCKYTKVVNNACLGFSKFNNPITGFLRINQNGEEEIIFGDGYTGDKIINLSNIPYEYEIDPTTKCFTKKFTTQLDCNELLLNPKISNACLEITKTANGNLPDGVYFVSVAYAINDLRFTDYISKSLAIQINNKAGTNGIHVDLTNLDRNFDKYQILLTGVVKGVTTHKLIGQFSTAQSQLNISDWVNDEYQDGIPSTELTVTRPVYDNTGIFAANSEYLFRSDIQKKPFLNYQPQAFNIKAQYYVKQVPLKYYKDNGEDIGYFRNENYNFVVRWYYTTGESTTHYQIANRKPNGNDLGIATGDDIFEIDANNKDCNEKTVVYNWEAYNTAELPIATQNDFKCNERIIGYGEMGYNQSDYNYPDVKEIFGDNSCTPIRNFRMPDESKVSRYEEVNGEMYINILGVKFNNIEHPKDKNGNYIKNISHYEILRSERGENDSTIISRGIVTNMGGWENDKKKKVLYSNFPFNSVQPNNFLSKKQTYKKKKKERNFEPLDLFYNDKFTYYTPYGNYFGRRQIKGFLEFETEEIGQTRGYFEETYKHPKHKLMTDFALFFSLILGATESMILTLGDKKTTKNFSSVSTGGAALPAPQVGTSNAADLYATMNTTTQETLLSLPKLGELKNMNPVEITARVLLFAFKALLFAGAFIFTSAKFAFAALKVIKDFSPYYQFARQYNGEVIYNKQKTVNKGSKRRMFLRQPFYLDGALHSVADLRINNGGRNSSVFVELNKPVSFPSTIDDSRKTLSELKFNIDSRQEIIGTSSVYYVTHKQHNPNQYGTLEGIRPVKIHICPIATDIIVDNKTKHVYESDILYGGDCIIAEETHLNKFPIFKQNLANAEYADGIEYDYRLYNNIGYARYWFDSTEYNMGSMMAAIGKKADASASSRLPNQKYNLDGPDSKENKWVEEKQCIYTSVNGVIRYIGETTYNTSFRKNDEEGEGANIYQPHFSEEQRDLSYIFRSDLAVKGENFELDPSYKYLDQKYVASEQLVKIPKANPREKNTVIYSLPSVATQSYNNWRYFLPLNRFTFDERDYGELTGVHAIDQDRIIFLFSKASPFLLPGRDELQTKNGKNITIGDAGLFARAPREEMHTDVAYGSNHDRYAFKSTQFGHFYVSELQGKLFNYSGKLEEISDDGWNKWCAEYIPLRIKREFPEYKQIHNPLSGAGYQIAFDNIYKTIYFCKKDFSKKNENLTYNKEQNQFYYNEIKIELGDPLYFDDCSLTLSYTPGLGFASFHDWIPDGIIQEERHFITAKENILWKHNERFDSFCNFYGKDYPYQIGFQVSTGQNVMSLQAIEYFQEAYIYKTNQLDRYHVYDQTFDYAIISNSEQCSGLLHLNDATNVRYEHELYPEFIGNHHIEIPFNKVENKFRFNMFYDYTNDRGRYTKTTIQPFITKKNGYDFILNPKYTDFTIQRPPRFRHYFHNVWMSREKSGNIQFITKFNNTKFLLSPR